MNHDAADAEALNTNEPGNVAGKPIQPDTDLAHGDNREHITDPADADAVWADATVTPHDPDGD